MIGLSDHHITTLTRPYIPYHGNMQYNYIFNYILKGLYYLKAFVREK
jgi:hypothetical protein